MAAHSGTLAWRIPWTEEPGGLQPPGSQSWTRLNISTSTQKNARDKVVHKVDAKSYMHLNKFTFNAWREKSCEIVQ